MNRLNIVTAAIILGAILTVGFVVWTLQHYHDIAERFGG